MVVGPEDAPVSEGGLNVCRPLAGIEKLKRRTECRRKDFK